MKIKERCKKIGAGILGGIVTFVTRVNASTYFMDYGIVKPEPITAKDAMVEMLIKVLKTIGIILMPIVLIIGLIVYTVKNKDNPEKERRLAIYWSILIVGIVFGIAIVVIGMLS